MKYKRLKLNIIPTEEAVSTEESRQRLVDFFALLYEWHLEDKKKPCQQAEPKNFESEKD